MDHRIGTRNKIALSAALSQSARFLGWFTTRDASPGGISLYGNVPDLANGSIVNVALQSTQADTSSRQSFKALVIHQADGCLGLMWVENLAGIHALLAEHASTPPPARHNTSFITFASRENP